MSVPVLLFCIRCRHTWASRIDFPKECPNCQTRFWASEKPKSAISAVHQLLPGQSVLLPWYGLRDGSGMDQFRNDRRNSAIMSYARLHGWKVYLDPQPAGMRVWRRADPIRTPQTPL